MSNFDMWNFQHVKIRLRLYRSRLLGGMYNIKKQNYRIYKKFITGSGLEKRLHLFSAANRGYR
jgi:hypothetical protein